jgi:hypothetical protein
VTDLSFGDVQQLLGEAALGGVEDEALDRELATLSQQLEAELSERRSRPAHWQRRYRRRLIRLVCTVCGAAFAATRRDARYCSTPCRVAAGRERHSGR